MIYSLFNDIIMKKSLLFVSNTALNRQKKGTLQNLQISTITEKKRKIV